MFRPVEEVVDGGLLDDLAEVHHVDPIADLGDDAHVVGHPDERGVVLRLEVVDEVEDLPLDGDVERRRRLVGDDERGLTRERHGDENALAHPAGELVGVAVVAALGLGDTHLAEHVDGDLSRLSLRDVAVDLDELPQLVADPEDGVERLHRVLEDDGDLAPPDALAHRPVGEHRVRPPLLPPVLDDVDDRFALELDAPADDLAGLFDQAHDRGRGDGLAGAALADEADDLARADVERDAVDGADDALVGVKAGL